MGDYQIIAAVSETLRQLLSDRMQSRAQHPPPAVTLSPPDQVEEDGGLGAVNLYLYHVTENAQLKNQSFPDPGPGLDAGPPPLSLDLHYLLTTFDEGNPGRAQELLGDAMQVFHTHPKITRALRKSSGAGPGGSGSGAGGAGGRTNGRNGDSGGGSILATELHEEYEDIKVTIEPLPLEEIANVWTAFTVPYRLSVAYKVTVVQIDSRAERRVTRLVGPRPEAGPRAHVGPFQTPKITELRVVPRDPVRDPSTGTLEWVARGERPYPYARIEDRLVVLGRNLSLDDARVRLDGIDVTDRSESDGTRLELQIPDEAGLGAGPLTIQLEREVIDRPGAESSVVRSNACVFMLVPRIAEWDADLQASPPTLTLEGSRLFSPDAESRTFLGDRTVEASDYLTASEDEIVLDVSALGSGEYPVRVRVGQAESLGDVTLSIS